MPKDMQGKLAPLHASYMEGRNEGSGCKRTAYLDRPDTPPLDESHYADGLAIWPPGQTRRRSRTNPQHVYFVSQETAAFGVEEVMTMPKSMDGCFVADGSGEQIWSEGSDQAQDCKQTFPEDLPRYLQVGSALSEISTSDATLRGSVYICTQEA